MTPDSLLAALRDTDMMLPLLFSLIAGALIGMEREFHGKPAGLRTHTLLCFASALMTLLGLRMAEWTSVLSDDTQVISDPARMPHAILTGIGFLGAGVIFREGPSVNGLTTAASLWLTAALGIVFGTFADSDSDSDGAMLSACLADHGLKAGPISYRHDRSTGLRHYTLVAFSMYLTITPEPLVRALQDNKMAQAFSICPLENEPLSGR